MVVWVILFFSLLWFKTNQTSVREQKRPCTAYQDTPEIHPHVRPKVGGVDLRAGCRARRVAVAAEVGKVVSDRAGVGKGQPCYACCSWRDLLLSLWEETIVTRERKRKKANKTPYYLKTKNTSKSHYIKTVKKSMTKHFKGNWRETKQNPSNLQSNPHKAMSIFLSRNSIVQERVEGRIQTIKMFKLPDKNTLSSSYISDMEKYGIPKQTKTEGVHHH